MTLTLSALGEARPEGADNLVHRQHRGHPGPVHGLQPRHHLRDTPPRRHCRLQGGSQVRFNSISDLNSDWQLKVA